MGALAVEFGWLPHALDIREGEISVETLPDLEANTTGVLGNAGVDGKWIYAPPQRVYVMGHGERERPYPSRIFSLPKTHRLSHAAADGPGHLDYLVWALGFFTGMRLTTTEAGFLDATPIQPRAMVDFVLSDREYGPALAHADAFWRSHTDAPELAKGWTAAVHALFLSHASQALQYERFIYAYTALEACFALAKSLYGLPKGGLGHGRRIAWLCDRFGMPVPAWADPFAGSASVAALRNDALHEALFMNAPLGFALHGVGSNQNLPLEMQALVCRFLVALLGAPDGGYVRSPVTTRQMHGWCP